MALTCIIHESALCEPITPQPTRRSRHLRRWLPPQRAHCLASVADAERLPKARVLGEIDLVSTAQGASYLYMATSRSEDLTTRRRRYDWVRLTPPALQAKARRYKLTTNTQCLKERQCSTDTLGHRRYVA
jgi:hypothetical protein